MDMKLEYTILLAQGQELDDDTRDELSQKGKQIAIMSVQIVQLTKQIDDLNESLESENCEDNTPPELIRNHDNDTELEIIPSSWKHWNESTAEVTFGIETLIPVLTFNNENTPRDKMQYKTRMEDTSYGENFAVESTTKWI